MPRTFRPERCISLHAIKLSTPNVARRSEDDTKVSPIKTVRKGGEEDEEEAGFIGRGKMAARSSMCFRLYEGRDDAS